MEWSKFVVQRSNVEIRTTSEYWKRLAKNPASLLASARPERSSYYPSSFPVLWAPVRLPLDEGGGLPSPLLV